jgi:hypothetical protein
MATTTLLLLLHEGWLAAVALPVLQRPLQTLLVFEAMMKLADCSSEMSNEIGF